MLLAYGVFLVFNMQVLAQLFLIFIALCLVGIVLALQPEIKKLLEQAGSKEYIKDLFKFWEKDKKVPLLFSDSTVNAIVDACENMQATKTGALIVFELDTPLEDIIATGQRMDAIVQKALLIQTFVKNTPLHDGAMVIKGNRIDSATCYLPLSNNMKISKDLGTRHRAGIGVTEQVNCFVLIVQEETGAISWAENGKLRHKVQLKELRNKLVELQHRKDKNYKKNNKQSKDKMLTTFKLKALHNGKEKVLQIVCACLIWLAVVNFTNPITTRRYQNIPVETQNTSVITSQDKTFDIVQGNNIQVIIRGRRQIIDNISNESIKAVADFNNINMAYAIPINIVLPEQYEDDVEVTYKSNETMRIELDDIAEAKLEPVVEVKGTQAKGTYVQQTVQAIKQVTVSGPSKIIQTIDKVQLDVDVNEASESFSTNIKPQIYDKNGNIINNSNIKMSVKEIPVSITILDTKEVKLNIQVVESKDDIRVQNVKTDIETVHLAGTDDILGKIDELNIEVDIQKDLDGLKQQKIIKVVDIKEYLSDGIEVAGESKVNLQMDVEKQQTKTFEIDSTQIEVRNMPNSAKQTEYSLTPGKYKITVSDFAKELSNLNIISLRPYIDLSDTDLSDLKHGQVEIDLPINIEIPEDSTLKFISQDTLHVTFESERGE